MSGQVTAARSGEALPGAQVVLQGTSYGAVTNRNGWYRIEQVPPGTYTLAVSYLGYVTHTSQVTVPSNDTATESVGLNPSFVQAEGIEVRVLQQGQAKALTIQKNANTIVNVVDQEQIEQFPDLNAAEAIQRVPGVNISRALGEGKFVFIRGTEPRLTSVTVNGQRLATSEDEERYVALDVISANQLASMQVTKALTPDMDADAIGGTVDLVTRSPFDRQERVVKFSGGGGYADLAGKPLYEATFTYSDRWSDKVGFTLNANYNDLDRVTHDNEMKYDEFDVASGGTLPFGLDDLELRRYRNDRKRYGVNGTWELRPSENSAFYIRGMYNKRDDDQNRNAFRYRVGKGDYTTETTTHKSRIVRALQDRVETQKIYNAEIGGRHQFESWNMDYSVTHTYGSQDKNGQIIPEFQLDEKVDLSLDESNPDQPLVEVTNLDPGYIMDPAHYELDQIDYRNEFTSDRETIAALNLEVPYTIGSIPASFKIGAKGRFQKKDRHDQRWRYKWKGDGTITMAMFAGAPFGEDFFQGAYQWGPTVDVGQIRAFLQENRGTSNLSEEIRYDDAIGDAYKATEDVVAGYAMTTWNMGRTTLVGGLRLERTSTDYNGTRLQYDDNGDFVSADPVADSRSYVDAFPMVHLKFEVDPRTNLRLAYTTGIARPNFFDLVPYFWLFPEDQQITEGNAELDPTFANSFDLMAEHYFQGIGILSGGLFYKKLDKIIYHRNFVQDGGPFDGYQVEQPVNGGNADLYGVELAWNQQFTFLPGFWSGFGIYGNYTHTTSSADLLYRDWTTLPGQASDSGNLALTYSAYGLNARASMNFNGKFIDEVGKSPEYDQIISNHTQWDFSSSYQVTPGAELYFNLVNLNDANRLDYLGRRSRPIQRERYSWWTTFGVKVGL